ncbi:MAG: hypothetical protein ACYCW6_17225 [Candidatus Xenobia bacterium]
MEDFGPKVTDSESKAERRYDLAIAALLTEPSLRDAATKAGVSERTLFRWQQTPLFRERFAAARRETVRQAIAKLQAISSKAVETLEAVMDDPEAPATAKVAAAKEILGTSIKAVEMEALEERLGRQKGES